MKIREMMEFDSTILSQTARAIVLTPPTNTGSNENVGLLASVETNRVTQVGIHDVIRRAVPDGPVGTNRAFKSERK